MTTCELRLKAAEIIEQRGWGKGCYFDGECYCLVGALSYMDTGQSGFLTRTTREALTAMGFDGNQDIAVAWNDAPGRTKEEVIARLRDGCEPVKASAESAS